MPYSELDLLILNYFMNFLNMAIHLGLKIIYVIFIILIFHFYRTIMGNCIAVCVRVQKPVMPSIEINNEDDLIQKELEIDDVVIPQAKPQQINQLENTKIQESNPSKEESKQQALLPQIIENLRQQSFNNENKQNEEYVNTSSKKIKQESENLVKQSKIPLRESVDSQKNKQSKINNSKVIQEDLKKSTHSISNVTKPNIEYTPLKAKSIRQNQLISKSIGSNRPIKLDRIELENGIIYQGNYVYIQVNGSMEFDKGKGLKYGLMEANILDNGRIIKRMVLGYYIILMVIFIKVNGKMIKQMVKELILTLMEQNIKVNGKMTNNQDMVLNNGQMVLDMKESMKMEQKMEKEYQNFSMEVIMKDNFQIIKFMVLGHIYGRKIENMKDIGLIIKCMVKAKLFGTMDVNMREIISMIGSMDLEYSNGPTEENIQEIGVKENSMEEENIQVQKVKKGQENGFKERGQNGLIKCLPNNNDSQSNIPLFFFQFYRIILYYSNIYLIIHQIPIHSNAYPSISSSDGIFQFIQTEYSIIQDTFLFFTK